MGRPDPQDEDDAEVEAMAAAVRRAFPFERRRHPDWPRRTAAVILAALHTGGFEVRRRADASVVMRPEQRARGEDR